MRHVQKQTGPGSKVFTGTRIVRMVRIVTCPLFSLFVISDVRFGTRTNPLNVTFVMTIIGLPTVP